MIKEAKEIDFDTTCNLPSDEDFSKISEWIKQKKETNLRLVANCMIFSGLAAAHYNWWFSSKYFTGL